MLSGLYGGIVKSSCIASSNNICISDSITCIIFIKVIEREYVISEMIPLLHNLANDEQDSVRLLSVDGCVATAGILDLAYICFITVMPRTSHEFMRNFICSLPEAFTFELHS